MTRQPSSLFTFQHSVLLNACHQISIGSRTPNAVSAVYHYYDPEFRERGLGTFLVLQCAELARRLQRAWVYLGYYVAGCAAMEYKTRFEPSEVLGVDGVWRAI